MPLVTLCPVIRPPDIVVMSANLYFTTDSFFFLLLLSFSPATVRASWMELNQNWPHAWKWLWLENACPKSGVSHPPTNWGHKTTFCRPLHNLTATLTAYIFRMKQGINKRQVRWQLGGVSYIVSKPHNFGSQTATN